MRTARKRAAAPSIGSTDHHRLLQVPDDATLDDLKRAYRHMAQKVHPDANPNDPAAAARFRQLTEAYAALAATAPDPDQDDDTHDADGTESGRSPLWNVFADDPDASPPPGPYGPTGAPARPLATPLPWRVENFVRLVFYRNRPLVELPDLVADTVARLLLVVPLAWAVAGFPGMFDREWDDVGQLHALLCAIVAVPGWFAAGAILWARAPVVPREVPRWRSPGWDGTGLIVRLSTFLGLAYVITAVVLAPRLHAGAGTPTRVVAVWAALVAGAWVVSGQVPGHLGYQSRYERYWRLDTNGLPLRASRARRRAR